jgi:hypothetical protein
MQIFKNYWKKGTLKQVLINLYDIKHRRNKLEKAPSFFAVIFLGLTTSPLSYQSTFFTLLLSSLCVVEV